MESTATTAPLIIAETKSRTRAPFTLHLREGIFYVFRSHDWFTDLGAGALCHFLAWFIVPPAIFAGYAYSVAETLHRQHGKWHPSFRTDKIADYLVRGMAHLALGLAVHLFLGLPLAIGLVLVLAPMLNGEPIQLMPWLPLLGAGWLLQIVLTFFTSIMAFRAGMANQFSAAFDFAWLLEFVLKTWPELILITVARVALRLVLAIVALLTAGFGGLFTAAYDEMVLAHWMYQTYRVHLARGGTPIPLSNE